jgi:hypothetical protein
MPEEDELKTRILAEMTVDQQGCAGKELRACEGVYAHNE